MRYNSKVTHKTGCLMLNVKICYYDILKSRIKPQNIK